MARVAGDLVFTAGTTPRQGSKLLSTGVVGKNISAETAQQLARVATTLAVENAQASAENGRSVVGVLSLNVFVTVDPSFTNLSYVADGASTTISEIFPEAALPARTSVGVASLPGGAPIEVQLVAILE